MSDTSPTTAAHIEAARQRGRQLLAAEVAHDRPYELIHIATAARDGLAMTFMFWAILRATGTQDHAWPLITAAAAAVAVYTGIANSLAVASQLRYWQRELKREQEEIRTQPEFEREELRAIYEAKGFSGQILDEIVDTLSADPDRLLKVMLEEELGIFFEQRGHPLTTGLLTGAASLAGGLVMAAATAMASVIVTVAIAAAALILLAALHGGLSPRTLVETFARWAITTGTVVAIAYFLGLLLIELRT